jgi:carbamoyltransferase
MAKLAFLGISFGYHDSAVSAVDANGQIVFAEHEERLSRIKHDNRFPINALENCASYLYKHEYAIEAIGYYENQFLKETRQLLDIFKYIDANPRLSSSKNTQGSPIIEHLANAISTNISCSAYSLEETIAAEVKSRYPKLLSSRVRCVSYDHHLSHAAGAFFSSPFDDSIILSMDGAGEFETVTIWSGRKEQNTLRKLWSAQLPFSLGLFYSAITSYLGFSVNEGEYKVMGLSAYGRPDYVRFFSDIIGFSDGTATVDADFFNFGPFSERLFTDKFVS